MNAAYDPITDRLLLSSYEDARRLSDRLEQRPR